MKLTDGAEALKLLSSRVARNVNALAAVLTGITDTGVQVITGRPGVAVTARALEPFLQRRKRSSVLCWFAHFSVGVKQIFLSQKRKERRS